MAFYTFMKIEQEHVTHLSAKSLTFSQGVTDKRRLHEESAFKWRSETAGLTFGTLLSPFKNEPPKIVPRAVMHDKISSISSIATKARIPKT